MVLSSTPADPPSSTDTTAAATVVTTTPCLLTAAPSPSSDPRPQSSPFPPPPSHYHNSNHRLPSQQPHQQPLYASHPFTNIAPIGVPAANTNGILYPVASSGHGFLHKAIRPQSADQLVTIANQGGVPPCTLVIGSPYSHTVRAFGFPHSDPHGHLIRSPHVHHTFVGSTGGGVMSCAAKGTSFSGPLKVAPAQPSVSECNGYRDQRDRSKDDTFSTVKDRKARIYEGSSSLYALCRSWLRNGFPEERQTQHVDSAKLLPRPSSTPLTDTPLQKESGEEEEERSVENLSPRDLLQRHVKHAKRVRARLREERLQRIAKYKTRLALLLPPLAEQQQFRNDTAALNGPNT